MNAMSFIHLLIKKLFHKLKFLHQNIEKILICEVLNQQLICLT